MEVMIDKFGKQDVKLYEIECINELLICTFYYENNEYNGLLDKNFRILIPFSTIPIQDCVFTIDQNNYCFSRYTKENHDCESFHLSRNSEDNLFYLRNSFISTDTSSIRITDTDPPKNNYWFVRTTTGDITEISLYDVKKGKIITPAFSLITFEKEASRVFAYIEKNIYATIDGKQVMLTSLSSYIDREGHFLSPLYDPTYDEQYDTLSYNFDDTFQSFECYIKSITKRVRQKFLEKQAYLDSVLDAMYANIYTEEEISASKCRAKLLKFPEEVKK